MLRITHLFSFLVICGLAFGAAPLAAKDLQKKSLSKTKILRPGKTLYPRRPATKKTHSTSKGKTLTPTARPANTNICSARRSVMEQEQEKLDDYRANVTAINVEIAELNRRIRELRAQSKDGRRLVTAQDKRVKRIKSVYERECKNAENCSQYEQTATNLERQSRPVEMNLANVRQEIQGTRTEIGQLQLRIRPLQNEYSAKKCSNQVPGQTSQATIDRCYAIFSEWNQLQASLNRHNSRLPQLRTRYERYLAQLTNIENRAQQVEAYLAKNCKASPKVKTIQKHRSVRENARQLGLELDKLIRDVANLRKAKITIQR